MSGNHRSSSAHHPPLSAYSGLQARRSSRPCGRRLHRIHAAPRRAGQPAPRPIRASARLAGLRRRTRPPVASTTTVSCRGRAYVVDVVRLAHNLPCVTRADRQTRKTSWKPPPGFGGGETSPHFVLPIDSLLAYLPRRQQKMLGWAIGWSTLTSSGARPTTRIL